MTDKHALPSAARNYIILSSIDWAENWQMHQHLASSLLAAGNRVLFVENTGVRAPRPTVSDLNRIWNRLRIWYKSTGGFRDVDENLTVYSPLILPIPYAAVVTWVNCFLMTRALSQWMRANRFHDAVVISFLPTPLAQAVIAELDPLAVFYYCANDMAGGSQGAQQLHAHEAQFLAQADAVFCISHALMERAMQFNSKVSLIPGGVDIDKFEAALTAPCTPADIAKLPGAKIGYVGTIGPVFDQALLCAAARAMPEASFILIGPEFADTSLLRAEANIHLLGGRHHDLVPQYLQAFDVTVIPYVCNPYTDAVYSCKLNEYLALGKPVVVTALREMRLYAARFPDVIEVAATPEAFIDGLKKGIAQDDPDAVQRRRDAARQNSWGQRFYDLRQAIDGVLAEKEMRVQPWQSRLAGVFHRNRLIFFKWLASVGLTYLLLFQTPAIWWVGQYLVAQQPAVRSDVAVVFSGDGEPGYVNYAYQRRALDAVKLYQAGYARSFVLSSGKRATFAETDVIRALLLEQGVPAEAIETVEGRPSSTVENVRLVADALRKANVKDVLFVTAPYHSRRASLVWEKQAPDIKVTVVQTADGLLRGTMRNVSAKEARVIGFEYLAIAYYWIKGWI